MSCGQCATWLDRSLAAKTDRICRQTVQPPFLPVLQRESCELRIIKMVLEQRGQRASFVDVSPISFGGFEMENLLAILGLQ
jgi:hypothetical protein